jgi:DNA-binding CsgD family transcriptional regulator
MPQRLAEKVLAFSGDVMTIRKPETVLSHLQGMVGPYELNILAAGVLPTDAAQLQFENWVGGKNLFFGETIPDAFWQQNQMAHAELGWDAIALKAHHATAGFTFAEVTREKPRRGDWIFDFLRGFGIADGYLFPLASWLVIYASPQHLALSPAMRRQLASAAQLAASRIATLVKVNAARDLKLTEREIEVLQARVSYYTNAAIAERLNIKLKTVDELLRRARLKLDAPNIEIALLTAYKLGLITF